MKNKLLTQIIEKMKKLVFTLGLCLIASISFGQKKAVTDALKYARDASGNKFAEARAEIKKALVHEETKNDPNTWYYAGYIENLQYEKENEKQLTLPPQTPNDAVMYEALHGIYPYFAKCYELGLIPDEKGKVKSPRLKDMKAVLKANKPYYVNAGNYFFEKKDYKRGMEIFDQYVEISDSPMMIETGKAAAATKEIDSSYIYANFYAALASAQLEDKDLAIRLLTRASKIDFNQSDILELLAEQYKNAEDTLNWEKTLNDAIALFPNSQQFLYSLINIYTNTNRNEKALEFVKAAIKNDQNNAQLYDVAGRLSGLLGDIVNTEEYYKKALEIDPDFMDAMVDMGVFYFNQGASKLEEASEINDVNKYNEEKEKVLVFFRKALPYLEKVLKDDPDTPLSNKITLRSIYYNLDMGDKFDEIDKLIDN